MSMSSLTAEQIRTLRRGDLVDYAVEARDGAVGRLSPVTADAAPGTIVVELGPLVFGELVVLPLNSVDAIDVDTETLLLGLSIREVRAAPRHDS